MLQFYNMTSDRSNSHTRVFSVEEVGFFEGAEKLLEMWFDLPGSQEGSSRGLRAVPKYVAKDRIDTGVHNNVESGHGQCLLYNLA